MTTNQPNDDKVIRPKGSYNTLTESSLSMIEVRGSEGPKYTVVLVLGNSEQNTL